MNKGHTHISYLVLACSMIAISGYLLITTYGVPTYLYSLSKKTLTLFQSPPHEDSTLVTTPDTPTSASSTMMTTPPLRKQDEAPAQQVSTTTIIVPHKTTQTTKPSPSAYIPITTEVTDTDTTYPSLYNPCKKPVTYGLGSFDTRFGMSREKFLSIAQQAIQLWEGAAGKTLFIYNPDAHSLTLNLVYDSRQEKTISSGYLASEIENSKQYAQNLKTAYETEKSIYEEDNKAFEERASLFQINSKAYQDKVTSYNEQGGASQTEYTAMMAELDALKKESEYLQAKQKELAAYVVIINTKITKYNELIVYINEQIKKLNSLSKGSFTEGRYSPSQNTIDIFQFSDETKLLRVLAHEFGHAIGIMHHTDTPSSIMYAFNSATTTELTSEDRAEIASLCQ